jgi:hypothetical protein
VVGKNFYFWPKSQRIVSYNGTPFHKNSIQKVLPVVNHFRQMKTLQLHSSYWKTQSQRNRWDCVVFPQKPVVGVTRQYMPQLS